mmetsp:Transcript_129321/g.402261  ORF Transcript_129321/g.402261 Transcript_129321/m.402261 type:complete len:361 (+) Transcript_129321:210-1292(+)
MQMWWPRAGEHPSGAPASWSLRPGATFTAEEVFLLLQRRPIQYVLVQPISTYVPAAPSECVPAATESSEDVCLLDSPLVASEVRVRGECWEAVVPDVVVPPEIHEERERKSSLDVEVQAGAPMKRALGKKCEATVQGDGIDGDVMGVVEAGSPSRLLDAYRWRGNVPALAVVAPGPAPRRRPCHPRPVSRPAAGPLMNDDGLNEAYAAARHAAAKRCRYVVLLALLLVSACVAVRAAVLRPSALVRLPAQPGPLPVAPLGLGPTASESRGTELPSHWQALFESLDVDLSGGLDRREFKAFASEWFEVQGSAGLKTFWREFDGDRSGAVTPGELQSGFDILLGYDGFYQLESRLSYEAPLT